MLLNFIRNKSYSMYSSICFSCHSMCRLCHLSLLWHAAVWPSTMGLLCRFLLHSPLNRCLGCLAFFLLLQAVSLGTFLQATLGATVKRFSGVISGSKVYTFAPCLDNTDLFSQGVPSFPPGPKPHPHNIPLRHLSDLLERGFEAGPERNLSICTALAPTLCTRGDNMAWEI